MKKRIVSLIFAVACLCISLVLASCSCDKNQDNHTHTYGEWTVAKEPTCDVAGERRAACQCGDVKTEAISPKGHSFNDAGVCTVCGAKDGFSYGLEYKLSSGGDYYIVTGIGTCTDRDIVIPGTYNGLPVKRIDGFRPNIAIEGFRTNVRSIVVSEGIETISTLLGSPSAFLVKLTLPKSLRAISQEALLCDKILELENFSDIEICNRLEEGDNYAIYQIDNIVTPTQGNSCIYKLENGFEFYSKDDVCYLIGYDKSKTELVLPDTFNGKSYKISDYLFSGNKNLVSVTIPNTIKDLGKETFSGCESLEKVVLPDGITEIGERMFWFCSSLKEAVIPNGVKTIGSACFVNCKSLERLVLPEGLLEIGDYFFDGMTSLEGVTIPHSVTTTEIYIYDCPNLKNVNNLSGAQIIVVENTEEQKEEFVFEVREGVPYLIEYNGDYENAVLPKDYNGQKYVIEGLVLAKNVTLSSGISEIRRNGIYGDKVYVDSLETLMGIEYNYAGIHGHNGMCELYIAGKLLTDLVIPKGTTELNADAFSGIELNSITLPRELKSISGEFGKIGRVYIEDLTAWCDIDFENGGSNPLAVEAMYNSTVDLYVKGERVTNLVIPQGVTNIKPYAFYGCRAILSVTLPEGLKSIGKYAFCSTNLMKITLPSTLEKVYERAFQGSVFIVEINNSSSIDTTEMLDRAIDFEEIKIFTSLDEKGGTVEALGDYAFYTYGNENYLVRYIGDETDLKLPENYKGANYAIRKNAFASIGEFYSIKIPEGVTEIGESAFINCKNLMEIYIPKTVKSVGQSCFAGCSSLCRVEFADGVEEIGQMAFNVCASLSIVKLPNSIKIIGGKAFSQCFSLIKIEIPSRVEKLESVFFFCRNLKAVTLNEGMKELFAAFYMCKNLESIKLPSTITKIGKLTFGECISLKAIEIPLNTSVIEREAFLGCDELTVYYHKNSQMENWEEFWSDGAKEVKVIE